MRISSTGTRRQLGCLTDRDGYTLMELMVTLAIIVIMSAAIMPPIQRTLRDAKMRSACRIVASTLNYARSNAVTMQVTTRVVFDQGLSVEVDVPATPATPDQGPVADRSAGGAQEWRALATPAGIRRNLPEGVVMTQVLKSSGVNDEDWLEFTKLGQADQALIVLTDQTGQNRYVGVDPITGRCRIMMDAPTEQDTHGR